MGRRGRRYIDYVQSYGASILGHAHPKVVEAIRRAALDGTTYGAPTEREVLLAETDLRAGGRVRHGAPGLERHRSGHERGPRRARLHRPRQGRRSSKATTTATATACSPPAAAAWPPSRLPASAGVPAAVVADTDRRRLHGTVPRRLDDTVAAVIVEPIGANHGLGERRRHGFLAGLRAECDRVGALLIFDEVITGFRICPASLFEQASRTSRICGASARSSAAACRWPRSAGAATSWTVLAPLGPVYQAGTLSGNPIATAAGLAVLELLDDDAYERLGTSPPRLAERLRRRAPRRRRQRSPHRRSVVARGVRLPAAVPPPARSRRRARLPGAYEIMFPSTRATATRTSSGRSPPHQRSLASPVA